jgi:threonine/homoserine/homoserine lactone efflux protein
MNQALEFFGSGIFFGLVSGVSPGPLLALVFSETLKHGRKEGFKVAIAPLITDLPIVLFVLFILSNLMQYSLVVGAISFVGAGYLIYLGFENLRAKIDVLEVGETGKNALRKGVIANFLNPSPYLFWLSIGGPAIFESLSISVLATILFVIGFYALLIGSKIIIAVIVDKTKAIIKSKYYLYVVRTLGIILILFALIFIKDGLELLGLI